MEHDTFLKTHPIFAAVCGWTYLSMLTVQSAPCPVPVPPPSHAGGIAQIIQNLASNPGGNDLAAARAAAVAQGGGDIDGCTLFLYLVPVKTCFVKKTWSDPILSLPTEWVESFRADIKQKISNNIDVDLDVAKEMLRRLRMDIQSALRRSDLPNSVKHELTKMLKEVEDLINDTTKKIETRATELAQGAAGLVADSMLNQWLALDFVADKGPVPAVTAEYSWQQGEFKSGTWNLLTSSTEITGLKQVTVSGKGNAKLSTSLGIALGVAAEVEAPAIVEISGSVGGALEGKEVASVVTRENVISFEPRYALTISVSAGLEAGWGIQLAGGLKFDYQLPLATPDATDTAFSLGQQSLTADENDKNKVCK